MKKAEIIKDIDSISKEAIEKCDVYLFDFINFINNEVAPHMTLEGLKILKNEYKSWINNNDSY